jgi:isoleucyl-tRNA synthetase
LASTIPPNSLDGWILAELDTLIDQTTREYETYQLHRVFRLLHDFCSVQISSIYGNAMKDRLYCDAPDSPLRRRCQVVMHRIVIALTKLLAPMLIFTADETWEFIPHKPHGESLLPSVHLALLPKPSGQTISPEQAEEWKLLMNLRADALHQLDQLKKSAGLNKAVEAEIVYRVDDDGLRRQLQAYGVDLEDVAGCGHYSFAETGTDGPAAQVKIIDRRESYKACARSWKRRPDVGEDAEYPDVTLRDAAALRAIAARSKS